MEKPTLLDQTLDRRQFLVRAAQLSLGTGPLFWLLACGVKTPSPLAPPPSPTTSIGAIPTAIVNTPSALPTAVAANPNIATPAVATSGGAATATVVSVATPDLAIAKGNSPKSITEAAIQTLGGMGRFVKPGNVVVLKPNICSSNRPEYAATTNPEVVETLVRLCLAAGAKTVKVFDAPFTGINTAYEVSGIEAAVKRAGGQMDKMTSLKYKKVALPKGKSITTVEIYDDILTADVVINVPIAKDHELARLTLGMKNLMGVIRDRGAFHAALGQRLADLATVVKPQLTVIDAVRTLTAHGPTGGNLADVRLTNTIIASADIVAVDSYAATLFNLKGQDLEYVRKGSEMGIGQIDYKKLNIKQVEI